MPQRAAILRHVAPFDAASDSEREGLERGALVGMFSRGQVLWREGDPPTAFTVIQSGLVKIVRSLSSGRESIVGIFGPRESIGDVAVIRNSPYPASAVVCSDAATIVSVPMGAFLSWSRNSTRAASRVAELLASRLHTMHCKVEILSAGSVESRMATLLLDLAERFGDESASGAVILPIALSRQELASLVSTSFETAIRVMSRWQKCGALDTGKDGFVIHDPALLRQAATSVLGVKGRR
ncbi:MAG: Crp/Fnr family transcriptional regulator [Deltaproteobacteria bacterium]|nr:Crp/Fnr family transcriptional regulator [Deltaproteobacteria bacterium]